MTVSGRKPTIRKGYVVISHHTVAWAEAVITRLVEGQPINPLEVSDVIHELNRYDPLDVIVQEAAAHVRA